MIPHAESQTQQDGKADANHEAVHEGHAEIEFGVAAAGGKGVHGVAQGAGSVNDQQIGQVFHTNGQHGAVSGKTAEHKAGEQANGQNQQGVEHAVDQQRAAQYAGGAVILARADVLTHHRASCGGHGAAHQIADDVQLIADARHGRNDHAVAVEPEVDKEFGEQHGSLPQGKG